jgi:metal-dependent amidase/aminoacylase/carboxypeptidase family protein
VTAKDQARSRIAAAADELLELSHRIQAHPESAWQEHRAAAWLTDALDRLGYAVTRGACQLPTAFTASIGTGELHIGICAEYDALPGLGHACGHNGIVTHAGRAPNAIPDRAEGRWYVRAASLAELDRIEPRVRACFQAGALATGCELTIKPESPPYAEFRNDEQLLGLFLANARDLGRPFTDPGAGTRMNRASTHMGNISLRLPAIHPYLGIDSLPASTTSPSSPRTAPDRPPIGPSWTAPSPWRPPSSTPRPATTSTTASCSPTYR